MFEQFENSHIHLRATIVDRWWRGLVVTLVSINVVALRRARLVLGWVTVCERVNHLGM